MLLFCVFGRVDRISLKVDRIRTEVDRIPTKVDRIRHKVDRKRKKAATPMPRSGRSFLFLTSNCIH